MPDQAKSAIVPVVLLALFAGYLFLDGVFLYLHAAQLALYAMFAAAAGAAAMLALQGARLPVREVMLVMAWLLAASAWLLPPLLADLPYPRYVLGDFVAILLPVMLLVVGLRHDSLFFSRNNLAALAAVMLLAALLAVPLSDSASRHEPPSTLLIAMAWATYFLAASRVTRYGALAALVVMIALAWTSGERTSLLLLLALGLAGRMLLMRRLRNAVLLGAGMLLACAAIALLFSDTLIQIAASTRLATLSQGELDTSLFNRILEVNDVWRQWSIEHWFGYGHGATFAPELSYPARNLTEHARVHHIHFGPMLLLYRYGVPGLLLYLWLVVDVLRYSAAMNRVRFLTADSHFAFLFSLALLGYLASFLVFSIIPDPAFSYVLAGYLLLRLTRPLPMPCTIDIRTDEPALAH